MAEDIDSGRITIDKSEVKTAILVQTANLIQVPVFENDSLARILVSKHGDMSKTWVSFTQDTIISMDPPFYVSSRLPCIIPIMEA